MTEPSAHDEAIAEAFWLAHAKDVQSEIVGELRARLTARGLCIVQAGGTGEMAGLREALEPSDETKAAYSGEFKFEIEDEDSDGFEMWRDVTVPWTTIKEIMKAISTRAALSKLPEPKPEMTERDWGGAAQAAARKVMTLFGWRQEPSNEPGDVMRDKIAALVQQAIDGASANPEAISEREKALRDTAVWRHDLNAYVPVQRSAPSEADEAVAQSELVEALRGDNAKLIADIERGLSAGFSCERCGAPLFDDDDFVSDPDCVRGCWASMSDRPSKSPRPCYAYRVGKPPVPGSAS